MLLFILVCIVTEFVMYGVSVKTVTNNVNSEKNVNSNKNVKDLQKEASWPISTSMGHSTIVIW